ncbi:MAG: alpha/beta hydrolase [Hyphomicrobiales bacterium]|nr:alpha/beta hydrolase [Hyphomicrobiales bacterium]
MPRLESAGVGIAYDVWPAAPPDRGEPVLLIHGFASHRRVNWIETGWTAALAADRRAVAAFDHRGHGESDKPRDPAAYEARTLAGDALRLLDALGWERADVIGYSMGARVAACLALIAPARVRSLVLGGLGAHLVDGAGLPQGVAAALEAEDPESVTDPLPRMFRMFADRNGQDRLALAACIRGSRLSLGRDEIAGIGCPTLVAVGTRDAIAGDPHALAAMLPKGEAFDIANRDHNPAVGDKTFKAAALDFLARQGT